MGRIANYPFPSFTLILTSPRVVVPGSSTVLRIAPKKTHNLPNKFLTNAYVSQEQNAGEGQFMLNFPDNSVSPVEEEEFEIETITDDLSELETEMEDCEATPDGQGTFFAPFVKRLRPAVFASIAGFFRRRSFIFASN